MTSVIHSASNYSIKLKRLILFFRDNKNDWYTTLDLMENTGISRLCLKHMLQFLLYFKIIETTRGSNTHNVRRNSSYVIYRYNKEVNL